MKKIILTLLSTFLSIPFIMAQQTVVFEEWKTDAGSQSFFYKSKTVTDGSGNVYITGATKNGSGDYDILTAKYNSSGVQQWIVQYNGAGNGDDGASALLVDGSGNVFITGTYYKDATDSNNYVTIKYNSSGTQQWLSTYNGTGSSHDAATAMCFDASGNIYVTGTSWGSTSLYDYATVKYNSSGTQQWASRYNHNGNMDVATKIVAGSTITVSGASENSSGNWSFATVQYNISTGAQVGSASRSSGTGTGMDNVTDIFQDVAGNIYVTGGVVNSFKGFDYSTIKFNSSLAVQWNVEYNGNDSLDDVASSVAVDGSGNVYVTGYSTTLAQGTNYVTIKYNSSGTLQWKKTYNGAGSSSDSATELVINASNDVIVTGSSINNVGNKDFYTIKYKSDSTILWEIGFDGLADLDDVATDIAVDNVGDIIVAGQSRLTDSTFEYATIKYTEKSILRPADTTAISSSFFYLENRGQLLDLDTMPIPQVKYYNDQFSPAVYFTDTSLSYVYAKMDTASGANDSLHRVDLICNGANVTKVRAMDMKEDYSSFFLGHIPSGRGRVPHYQRLVYPNVYDYIDLLYGSNSMGMKYYFVVKPNTGGPGGNVADIDLVYNGADSLAIGGSGELIIYTQLGTIVYPRPKAFKDSAGIFVSLYWQPTYSLTAGNHIAFNVGAYNTNVNLILQMDYGDLGPAGASDNINWSTYMGGQLWSEAYSVINDNLGNIYVGGYAAGTNFPTYNGFQMQVTAGDQATGVIMKFITGTRALKWSTYFGGQLDEKVYSLAILNNKLYATGYTESSDFPYVVPQGGAYYDSQSNSYSDAFIAAFNSFGFPTWTTYFGGDELDFGTGLAVDPINNYLYVTGAASDDMDIVNPGGGAYIAYWLGDGGFPLPNAGDAFIARFNSLNQLEWSTFFGGSNTDGGASCKVDNSGNVYLFGFTQSSDLDVLDAGGGAYYQNTYGGTSDCFIAEFNSAGNQIWTTFYGGTDDDLPAENDGIAINSRGVFFVGNTQSSDLPTHQNAGSGSYWQPTKGDSNSNLHDGFVVGFNSSSNILLSTYLGGDDDDMCEAITTGYDGDLILSGYTASTDFPTVNFTGYHNNTGTGNYDGFVSTLELVNLQMQWSTYIGGSNVDFIYGISQYQNSSLYIVGAANAGYVIWDPLGGAYMHPTYNATFADMVITEFSVSSILSVRDINHKPLNNAVVYPNPNNGLINIVGLVPNEKITVEIVNILGQVVFAKEMNTGQNGSLFIDMNSNGSGVYTIKVVGNDFSSVNKIIKQ